MEQAGHALDPEHDINQPIESKTSPEASGSPFPPMYESMVATNKFMTTNMNAWDWVWRTEHEPSETPRFGSLFRQFPGLPEYYQSNIRPHWKTGVPGPSFSGWEKAIVGMIALDIDKKDMGNDEANLQAALEDAKKIVLWLRQSGVRDQSWTAFQSGLKGLSFHFFPEVFGPLLLEIKPGYKLDGRTEIRHGHKRAAYLALEALCNGVGYDRGSYETLRLFRIPNSKHDKSPRFKIPLTGDEILSMNAGEIMALAAKPRLDLPTIPSSDVDQALVRMLEEKHRQAQDVDAETLEKNRTRAALRDNWLGNNDMKKPAQKDSENSFGIGTDGPVLESIPENVCSSIIKSIIDLSQTHAWLRDAWNSVPRIGKKNSQSEFDFRLCVELLMLNWNIEDVRTALFLRSGSNSMAQGQHYVERTLNAAAKYALGQKAKRPIERILSTTPELSIAKHGTPLMSWVRLSNLWKPKVGIGRACRDVWLHHLDVALGLDLKSDEHGWHGPYYLPRADIAGRNHRPCSERTMDKSHVLLESICLLERLEVGGWGEKGERIATSFKVRLFDPEDEGLLIRAGTAALNQLKDAEGKLSLSKKRRLAAKNAGRMVLLKNKDEKK